MKTLRLVVALRLAFFPVVLNLSFAEESEVITEDISQISPDPSLSRGEENTSLIKEGDHEVVEDLEDDVQDSSLGATEWQTWSELDSSEQVPQNDVENAEEPHPNPLLLGEGSYEVAGEVLNQDAQDSQQDIEQTSEWIPQNDNDIQEDEDDPSDDEIILNDGTPELIISEVYYDGKSERIEIFNIGDGDFLWDIELSWARSKPQIYNNIQIPADDFLIIANSDEMFDFSQTENWDVNILLNTWNYKQFSIADTKEIQIFLLLSWEVVDEFYAHEYRVKYRNDEKISFQKVISEWRFVVTWSYLSEEEDRQNVRAWLWVIATPWVLIETSEKVKDYAKDPNSEPEDIPPADCSDAEEDIITISEVFRWWNRYQPFVEFFIHEDIEYEYDYLLLSDSAFRLDPFHLFRP